MWCWARCCPPELGGSLNLPSLRQCLLALLIVFVAYAVLTSPTQAGDMTASAWGHVKDGAGNIGTFFDSLLKS